MKLTTMTQVTVDGVMQGNGGATDEDRRGGFERGGWAMGVADNETMTFINQTYQRADAFLFGRFDFAQTLRALVNLIDNAAKYAPAASPIELAVRRDGDELAFTVSDRGPGVPPEEAERIFDAFYRRSGAAPDVGGTGLGLSIARGIARAQGGDVTFEPRAGGGSVFRLTVPAIRTTELPSFSV